MAKGTIKAKVSKALIETVAEHENIHQIHFDALNNHYFNVHEFKHVPVNTGDKEKDGERNKKLAAINGNLYGRIAVKHVAGKEGQAIKISNPIENTRIVESVDREDLLAVSPESDLSLTGLNEEEAAVIAKLRAKKAK
jgi:hypothetical protein